jgi:hypothetical protein
MTTKHRPEEKTAPAKAANGRASAVSDGIPGDPNSMESIGASTSFADPPPTYPTGTVLPNGIAATINAATSAAVIAAAPPSSSSSFPSSMFTPVAPGGAASDKPSTAPTSFTLRVTVLDKNTMGPQPSPTPSPAAPSPSPSPSPSATETKGSHPVNNSSIVLDPNLLTPPIDLSQIHMKEKMAMDTRDDGHNGSPNIGPDVFQVMSDQQHLGYARRRRDLPVRNTRPHFFYPCYVVH